MGDEQTRSLVLELFGVSVSGEIKLAVVAELVKVFMLARLVLMGKLSEDCELWRLKRKLELFRSICLLLIEMFGELADVEVESNRFKFVSLFCF